LRFFIQYRKFFKNALAVLLRLGFRKATVGEQFPAGVARFPFENAKNA
jgi:hypothetical protein